MGGVAGLQGAAERLQEERGEGGLGPVTSWPAYPEHISTSVNLGFLSANAKHVNFLCPIGRLSVTRQGPEGSFSIAKLHVGYFPPKELADVIGQS